MGEILEIWRGRKVCVDQENSFDALSVWENIMVLSRSVAVSLPNGCHGRSGTKNMFVMTVEQHFSRKSRDFSTSRPVSSMSKQVDGMGRVWMEKAQITL
jgi:hypothetical protein